MQRYIYGVRGGIHIIDLTKTAPALAEATQFVRKVTAGGGKILFVCTKRQGKEIVRQAAVDADMPYVVERWLGGMLTNFRTIKQQVDRLKKLEDQQESGELSRSYNKKEVAEFADEITRLNRVFGGIKGMATPPEAIFVVDAPKEKIAIQEAIKLGIAVVALADSNADPDLIDYPIPGNDDAVKSIKVITKAVADSAKEGQQQHAKEQAAQQVKEEQGSGDQS